MKHYISELTMHNSSNLKKIQEKKEIFTLFICPDGQYQIVNNTLYKYTFPNSKSTIIKDYIANYTLLSTETEILDTKESYWRLAPEHITKEIKRSIFTIHPNSQTSFVIESCEGNIIDYYFESPHHGHQKTLKDDISSLLSYLK